MSNKIAAYDPSSFQLSILGVDVQGFVEGVFTTLERTEPVFTYRRAIDGSTNMFIQKYATRRLTFTIDKTSPSNTWIHLLFDLFNTYGEAFKMPVLFKDRSGETSFFATECFFESEPSVNHSDSVEPITWTLLCFDGKPVIGGNVVDEDLGKAVKYLNDAIKLASLAGVDLTSFDFKLSEFIERGIN